jgi:hypothetical protein
VDELHDFYDRYLAAFNARDDTAFAAFFHLPVTIFPLPSAGEHHGVKAPVIVAEMGQLRARLPAKWTKSALDHLHVLGDAGDYTPRDGLAEPQPRRLAITATVTRWAGDQPYEQVHVLYLLGRKDGRLGITAMAPLASADDRDRSSVG